MIYSLYLPGDFLGMDLNDEKWREVVSCARGGMNTHIEDEIEGSSVTCQEMTGGSNKRSSKYA